MRYEQLAEADVKLSIRQFLEEIIAGNESYLQKLKFIQSKLTIKKNKISPNKFSSIIKNKGYEYYALELSKNNIERKAELDNMYHCCNEIISKMLGLTKLTYSIYYKTDQGKILRITTTDISKGTQLIFGDSALMLQGSNIKTVYSDELETIANNQKYVEALSKHYQNLELLLMASSASAKKYNQYIPEAFERDMLNYPHNENDLNSFNEHRWSVQEAWQLIKESSGTAPWYSGGDILSKMFNVQVKGFTAGKENRGKFSRLANVTSLRSLEDIANYLITLLDVTKANIDNKVNEIYRLLNQHDNSREIEYCIEKDVEKIKNKIIQKSKNINSINFFKF